MTPGSNTVSSTLTVSTKVATTFVAPPVGRAPRLPTLGLWLTLSGVALVALGLLSGEGRKSRRRRFALALGLAVILVVAAVQVSCGGSGTPPPAPTGQPSASLTPSSLTFSSQKVGSTSAAQPVALKNTGNAALEVNKVAASGDFSQTNNCGTSVAAGGNCTVNVTFTPTATGTRNGTLTITDNNNGTANSAQTVSLTGTGAASTFSFTIRGTSGSLVESGTAALTVN